MKSHVRGDVTEVKPSAPSSSSSPPHFLCFLCGCDEGRQECVVSWDHHAVMHVELHGRHAIQRAKNSRREKLSVKSGQITDSESAEERLQVDSAWDWSTGWFMCCATLLQWQSGTECIFTNNQSTGVSQWSPASIDSTNLQQNSSFNEIRWFHELTWWMLL